MTLIVLIVEWLLGATVVCTIVWVIKLHLKRKRSVRRARVYRCHSDSSPPHRVRNRREHLRVLFFLGEVAQRRKDLIRVMKLECHVEEATRFIGSNLRQALAESSPITIIFAPPQRRNAPILISEIKGILFISTLVLKNRLVEFNLRRRWPTNWSWNRAYNGRAKRSFASKNQNVNFNHLRIFNKPVEICVGKFFELLIFWRDVFRVFCVLGSLSFLPPTHIKLTGNRIMRRRGNEFLNWWRIASLKFVQINPWKRGGSLMLSILEFHNRSKMVIAKKRRSSPSSS